MGNSYTNTPINVLIGDLQDHTITIDKDDYSYKCIKLLFVDYIEGLLIEDSYLDINNKIYKIIKVDTYSQHMEVYLFYCNLKDIKVNGIDKKVLITGTTDVITMVNEKIIASDFEIKTGDLFEYQGDTWILISEIDRNEKSYQGRIRKCKKLEYNNQVVYGLVDSQKFDITTSKTLDFVDNQIIITLNDKYNISLNDMISFKNCDYSVIAINETLDNTVVLKCEFSIRHNYSINITNTEGTLNVGNTIQLNTVITDNTTIVTDKNILYNSSNNSIATVDNSGLITALQAGQVTITANIENTTLEDTITLIVEVQEVIEYRFTNLYLNELSVYSNKTYEIFKYINNVASASVFTFAIDYNGCPTTIAVLQNIDGNHFKITANSGTTYGTIKIIVKENNVIVREEFIKIKSMW